MQERTLLTEKQQEISPTDPCIMTHDVGWDEASIMGWLQERVGDGVMNDAYQVGVIWDFNFFTITHQPVSLQESTLMIMRASVMRTDDLSKRLAKAQSDPEQTIKIPDDMMLYTWVLNKLNKSSFLELFLDRKGSVHQIVTRSHLMRSVQFLRYSFASNPRQSDNWKICVRLLPDEDGTQKKSVQTDAQDWMSGDVIAERNAEDRTALSKEPFSLDKFVDLPGFFRIEKHYLKDGQMTLYMVGADPLNADGERTGAVGWGEGASIAGALEDWRKKSCSIVDPRKNAERYWEKRAAAFHDRHGSGLRKG